MGRQSYYIDNDIHDQSINIYEFGKDLGYTDSPWIRWDFKFDAMASEILWDVILEPAQFIATRYVAMNWVMEAQPRDLSDKMMAENRYRKLVSEAKNTYGKLLDVMLEVEGSPEKVIQALQTPGIPEILCCGKESPVEYIKHALQHE